ncbi:long-chain-fatty-acid--CoA ligase ACSBG2-like isoform X3 [Mustela erminea]|uniref:long-chain-fatty-acid--CoA ligase ACSBG2-like isoform X3 n=1 Tax=Mustela erminea TaxID=36723 RepID=UPI0013869F0B|nr:long-chain-fatty-acid--CoA ligase ACSBG2-like isoform X3 [Mustela erminea]
MSSRKTLSPTERDRQSEVKAKEHPYCTSKRDGEVHLRQEDAFTSQAPLTVHDMVMNTAIKYANYIALGSKHRNGWHLLTYIEYYEECRRAAKAFLKLGLERFHGVGIMGLNSEEWVIASIGAIMAGGFSVGILATNSPKACQVIAESSEIDIFVVDNDRQLQKIIQIQGSLKHLKAIVQYKEEIRTRLQNLYSWRGFLDLAGGISEDTLDRVIDSQKPNQCCMLVYSLSGTGPPKAMMLSHDNITWTTLATAQRLSYKCPPEAQEILVNYLPLSYMGAQLLDMWVSISVAGTLYFAPPDALRGSLIDTLREVKPTLFHGVPWVWDRLLDNLKTDQLSSSPFRRRVDQWAMGLGLRTNRKWMFKQTHPPLCFGLAKRLTFNQARKFLGLHHCRQYFSLGLGLSRATLDYFLSLNMPILALYGLSESTGIHTVSRQHDFRLLSCGKSLPRTHIKTQNEDEESIGDIYIWGRNVFMGYLNDAENNQEKFDAHGWLRTGDLGFLDTDKFLYVVGNTRDHSPLPSSLSACRYHHPQFRREDQPEPHRGAGEAVHPSCALRGARGSGRALPVRPAYAQVPDQHGHRGAPERADQRGRGFLPAAQEPGHPAVRHRLRRGPCGPGVHWSGHRCRQRRGHLRQRQDHEVDHPQDGLLGGWRGAGSHHQTQEGHGGQDLPS